MWRKTLPKRLALAGAAATIISLGLHCPGGEERRVRLRLDAIRRNPASVDWRAHGIRRYRLVRTST